MPTPRPDTASIASGADLWAGRDAPYPAWRTHMTTGTWAQIPQTVSLDDIDPRDDPEINPNFPSAPEFYGIGGWPTIITAWNGGCYDQTADEFWLPLQGGHADYAGNDPLKAPVNVESVSWSRLRNPSGAVGNLLTTDDGQETTGVYADGQPRSIHSYNKPVFVPGFGPVIACQMNTSWSGSAGTSFPVYINPTNGNGTLGATCPSRGSESGGAACYDPTRGTGVGVVWWKGNGTGSFCRLDPLADSWVTHGSDIALSGYNSLAYMPGEDVLLIGNDGLAQDWAVFDPVTNTMHQPTFSGTPGGGLRSGVCQPLWYAPLGCFLAWDNSTDRTLITTLTPGADPRSDTWTIGTLSVDGSNAVTPSVRQTNGTYGRFFVSPNLKVAGVLNGVTEQIYAFALEDL